MDAYEVASYLFDGGWRASDADDLAVEYGLEDIEVVEITEYLRQFEEVME